MRISVSSVAISLVLVLPSTGTGAPWFVNLEETMHELPWVIEGEIISADSDGVTAVVTEVFAGYHIEGDTLSLCLWEMGSGLADALAAGERLLLLPDETGALQITGIPGDGYWVLSGCFDFNAFWLHPGVLDREEVLLLCAGDSLPDRAVEAGIRFAGGSRSLELSLLESGNSWVTVSPVQCLEGLRLENWMVKLGGMDAFPHEPDVEITLPAGGGRTLKLCGRMYGSDGGTYRCRVYPTAPLILSPRDLVEYMSGISEPSGPLMDVELFGAEPRELGLADAPRLTADENGYLHLTGIGGMMEVTHLFYADGREFRPLVGFAERSTCADPLYFSFQDLPEGPSGHLATDIIDFLSKGYVTGTIFRVPGEAEARFTLFMMRR